MTDSDHDLDAFDSVWDAFQDRLDWWATRHPNLDPHWPSGMYHHTLDNGWSALFDVDAFRNGRPCFRVGVYHPDDYEHGGEPRVMFEVDTLTDLDRALHAAFAFSDDQDFADEDPDELYRSLPTAIILED